MGQSGDTSAAAARIRDMNADLERQVGEYLAALGGSRELSLARTKFQEGFFWLRLHLGDD